MGSMGNDKSHIPPYGMYLKTVVILLLLTALNITIATLGHSNWTAGIIVAIATIQAGIMLTWFMHLRWDNKLFRTLVIGVFVLYAIIVIITFLDYKFR
jgi:cytochrome c oxidase subunit IV